jgi:hypothetical protein
VALQARGLGAMRRQARALGEKGGQDDVPARGVDLEALPRWIGQLTDLDIPEHRVTQERILWDNSPSDHVLEPSAGTGLLAIFAELAGASVILNELAETRAGLLGHLFPDAGVTRFDAARIDDHLDPGVAPTVVLLNLPFSALANVDRRRADAALRHVSSALARLAEGGRLVAITQASLAPDSPAWREDFQRLQSRGSADGGSPRRRIPRVRQWER